MPPLHRLMRILEMHKKGMLEWDEKVHNEYRSNDDALLEILKTDSLVDDVLNDWFKYIKKRRTLSKLFLANPKKEWATTPRDGRSSTMIMTNPLCSRTLFSSLITNGSSPRRPSASV